MEEHATDKYRQVLVESAVTVDDAAVAQNV